MILRLRLDTVLYIYRDRCFNGDSKTIRYSSHSNSHSSLCIIFPTLSYFHNSPSQMQGVNSAVAATAAVLLDALPLALAHDNDRDMGGKHSANIAHGQDDQPMSYFSYLKHSGLLWTYVSLMLITWIVFAPSGNQPV